MESLVVTATLQNTARVFVDDNYLAVHDHVVTIFFEQFLGTNRIVQIADQRRVHGVIKIVNSQFIFNKINGFFMHADGLFLFVYFVVLIKNHFFRDSCKLRVPLRCLVGRSANNQWRSGFIDQNGVDFVDDGKVLAALNHFCC